MHLTTPEHLGLFILEARRKKHWSQSDLAAQVGVSRQWLSMVENGKTTVEFDLVFHVLRALGYSIHLSTVPKPQTLPTSDIDPDNARTVRTSLTRRGRPLNSRNRSTD